MKNLKWEIVIRVYTRVLPEVRQAICNQACYMKPGMPYEAKQAI